MSSDLSSIFTVPPEQRSRTSDVLLALAERAREENVTLRTMTDRLGDRTFGVMLIVIAAFNVIPFISMLAGPLVSVLGIQMFLGLTRTRLPAAVLDWELPPERVEAALLAMEPRVRSIERYIRPRWHFTEAPVVDRLNGLIIVILGLVIAIPVPFTNIAPALVVIVMGLGLLERDGLVQILALASGLATVALVYTIFSNAQAM